ncbi:hypothetical protein VFPPC_17950 [Pochonia chlamydosporia 170]|uniref:Uncharacterized protein n=1 Tax=Pochonia chlamydosporia 170 TaxID=1380566 RepID=A0A219APX0_METCM|nr:hypothetical protein VFPPC_17950 [Pochonia chlamydosporia 170]OWT42857.1 hypothetical protein VFPPC_17950 [Pochonia chlamydosporia 170]
MTHKFYCSDQSSYEFKPRTASSPSLKHERGASRLIYTYVQSTARALRSLPHIIYNNVAFRFSHHHPPPPFSSQIQLLSRIFGRNLRDNRHRTAQTTTTKASFTRHTSKWYLFAPCPVLSP